MKFSRFNIWAQRSGELILFNTLSCALAVFDSESAEAVQRALEQGNPSRTPTAFFEAMSEDGYVVTDGCNELEAIRMACAERRAKTDEYSLCIVLTMLCNFDCFYCFEKHRNEQLSAEETVKVLSMFRQICRSAKKVDVDWFGGEPLLAFEMLRDLNDQFMHIAKASGVTFGHSITTNGFGLTDAIIEYLSHTPLTVITITLDGPSDTHDLSRPLRSGGPTFRRILDNVKRAVARGLKVSIRINMTKENTHRILDLFHLLEQEGLKNRVEMNIQAVVSSSSHPCEAVCLPPKEFAFCAMEIYLQAAREGWIVLPPTERMRALGFCVGEYPSRLITDLKGYLYRCGQMFEGDNVGYIRDDGSIELDPRKNDRWINKDPLQWGECRSCPLLPMCMGGCNLKRYHLPQSDHCLDWKHCLPAFLETLVLNEQNILTNGGATTV